MISIKEAQKSRTYTERESWIQTMLGEGLYKHDRIQEGVGRKERAKEEKEGPGKEKGNGEGEE